METRLSDNQRIFIALFAAVFMWISGLYTGLNRPAKVNFKYPVESVPTPTFPLIRSPCPDRIAVAWDVGRFGNKFFEFLSARFSAEVLGNEIFITKAFGEVYDAYFTGRQTAVVDWNYLQYKCGFIEANCKTLQIGYLPELKPVSSETFKCIKFEGYPVYITSKQWEAIYSRRDQLIKEFQWKPDLKKSVDRKLNQVKASRKTSIVVAVHARRTDYYVYLNAFYGTFRPANASYYNKAMDYFRTKYSKPAFLVFSDDMQWCRENLKGHDVVFTGNGNQTDPGYDLALISSCDHIILSYGTFGMAAAWFNNHGEIISADNFTGKPERMVEELKKVPSLNWKWTPV